MQDIITYSVIHTLQMLVFFIYLKEVIGIKRSFRWMILCWGGAEIVNISASRLTASAVINGIVLVLVWALAAMLMCRGSWKKIAVFIIIYYNFNKVAEIVSVSTVTLLNNLETKVVADNNMTSAPVMVLTQMFVLLIIQVVKCFCKRKLSYDVRMQNWLGALGVTIGCLASAFILTVEMIGQGSVLVILVCINFLSYYFYYISAENNRIELEAKMYQKQIAMYQERYENIQDMRKEIHAFGHDMNNHFTVLQNLCKNGIEGQKTRESLIEIEKYLRDIGVNSNYTPYHIDSGNLIIDSMIELKKRDALSKGISMKVDLEIPRDMNYNSMDMITVLGNLLDNAIEACEHLNTETESEILLKIVYHMRHLAISIKNTYDGHMDGTSGIMTDSISWKTTKKDTGIHGIGMKNIMDIIKKYNGILEWNAENGKLKLDMLLYHFDVTDKMIQQ